LFIVPLVEQLSTDTTHFEGLSQEAYPKCLKRQILDYIYQPLTGSGEYNGQAPQDTHLPGRQWVYNDSEIAIMPVVKTDCVSGKDSSH